MVPSPPLIVATLLFAMPLLAQESAPATRPESSPLLSRGGMEADLDSLAAAIRDKWSYLEDKSKNFGVDLDALVAAAKGKLPGNGTKADFHEIVAELVAGLKDGHANAFTLGVPTQARRWPLTVAEFSDGVFVVKAMPIAADTIGAKVAQVIGSGRVSIEDKIAEAERRVCASTPAARRALALNQVVWTSARSVTLELERTDPPRGGQLKGAPRFSVTYESLEFEPPEISSADPGPFWSVDHPRPDVARLRVRTFAVDRWTEWLAAKVEEREGFVADTKKRIDDLFRELAGSRALVIDLRGNGGGTDLLGIHVARHLLPKRFVYFQLSAKRDGKWSKPFGYEHDPFPSEQRFDGPLAFLIDEICFSTTDNFLRAVIENRKDVIVVGRPTNGGTGAPAVIAKLPNSETFVTLCTQRVYGPNGTLTEGRGTQPTIPVRWSSKDYFEKRDPDLEAALAALGGAESKPK